MSKIFFACLANIFLTGAAIALPRIAITAVPTAIPSPSVCLPTPTPKPVTPFPSQCDSKCPGGITVLCDPDNEWGASVPNLGSCTMTLGHKVCSMLGFVNGKKYPLNQFKSMSQCQGKVKTMEEAFFCCAVRHEMLHACDATEQSVACSETEANNYLAQCMNDVTQHACGSEPPRWSVSECKRLCSIGMAETVSVKIWDSCNCDASKASKSCGKGFNLDACCRCTNQCTKSRITNLIPPSCSKYITNQDMEEAVRNCKLQANEGAHTCSYFQDWWDGKEDLGSHQALCPEVTAIATAVAAVY